MAKQDLDKTLADLFDAERQVRKLQDELESAPAAALLAVLQQAAKRAHSVEDEEDASMQLELIAETLHYVEGDAAVDLLIDILDSDYEGGQGAASEALERRASERFKEVALGIERALSRLPVGSPALAELPWLISDIPEPGVTKLLIQCMKHEDGNAVGAAIEVAVVMGDAGVIPVLETLAEDMRTVETVDEEGGEPTEVTIADLVEEALDILKGGDDELEESETKH